MNIISIYVRISVCKIVDLHGPRDEVPSFAVHQFGLFLNVVANVNIFKLDLYSNTLF